MARARSGASVDISPSGERLQRVLAARGVASRRASEDMIRAGRIAVNGQVVTELGTRVDPVRDEIRVDGKVLRRQRPRFILLNKPSGFITTVKDERQRWTVMDLVEVPERVYPVGRLDRETQGLLLLTNEGEVANRVMHPRYGLTKEYHVFTEQRPEERQLQRLRDGVNVAGRRVVPDECRLLRETPEGIIIKIVIHEGLYHVVRTMMELVGITVIRLRRVRLGPLRMQGIPTGSWRDLTPGELVQLYEAVGLPADAAERANEQRTIQTGPAARFRHGDPADPPGPPNAPAQPMREPGARPPADRPARGHAQRGDGVSGPRFDRQGADRSDRRDRSDRSGTGRGRSGRPVRSDPGRPNDGPRSPFGRRDRRPRRGR